MRRIIALLLPVMLIVTMCNAPVFAGNDISSEEQIESTVAVDTESHDESETIAEKAATTTGIKISEENIRVDEWTQFSLTVLEIPSNTIYEKVHWETSDWNIVSYEYNDGAITFFANRSGKATLTAITDNGQYTASCDVIVDGTYCNIGEAGYDCTYGGFLYDMYDFDSGYYDPGVCISKAKIIIGGKTYTGKVSYVDDSWEEVQQMASDYTFNYPTQKIGTKATVILTDREGIIYRETITLGNYHDDWVDYDAYRGKKKLKIKVYNSRKGDVLKVKVGGKKYTKKITKDSYGKTVTIKIKLKKKMKWRQKVVASLYNCYGVKKDVTKAKVLYAKKPKRGMSAAQAKSTTWGSPDSRYKINGYTIWYYEWESGKEAYVFLRNGRVKKINIYNY